jgi:Response regulator containing CheY-like receiver, AAA-type ATPase, and DNA-binding domains
MTTPGVLIVDDEIKLCRNIALKLKREGFVTYEAYDGKAAIRKLQKHSIHVVILDFMLTDMTGLDVLKQIKQLAPRAKVYMLTAYGNVENAVLAMKLGASDYLNKPFDLKQLADIVKEAYRSLNDVSGDVVFKSPRMQAVREVLERIATTDVPVLLHGEQGSGKSTLARWVHARSRRSEQPFLSVYCKLMPEELLGRELFGASGKAVAADGGTLYLDEVGELTPLVQGGLLRLLEEGKVVCPDTNETITVDLRLITSSSVPLHTLVKEGRFGDDLYYRLNLVEAAIPPLKDRREDIPLLVRQKLEQLNVKYGKPLQIAEPLMELLTELPWPGNIEELMNLIERMHLLKLNGALEVDDLPDSVLQSGMSSKDDIALQGRLYDVIEKVEEKMITDALNRTGGNQSKAAELLGISRNALIYKMKRFTR